MSLIIEKLEGIRDEIEHLISMIRVEEDEGSTEVIDIKWHKVVFMHNGEKVLEFTLNLEEGWLYTPPDDIPRPYVIMIEPAHR